MLRNILALLLLITIKTSLEAKNHLEAISIEDRALGQALLNSKWINRFSYHASEQDSLTTLLHYLWHFKDNIKTLESDTSPVHLGPISTISPETLGKLMGFIYTKCIFQESNEELIQNLYDNYTNKISHLQTKLNKYLPKLEQIKSLLKRGDKRIRELSAHIDKAKKELIVFKKKHQKELKQAAVAKKMRELKQKIELEKKKVEKPRRKLLKWKKRKSKIKMKISHKISCIIEQIEAEHNYLTGHKQMGDTKKYKTPRNKIAKTKRNIEKIKSAAKPYIKTLIESIKDSLQNTNLDYAPNTTESILWAFFLSRCDEHDFDTCICEMCNTIKQSNKKISELTNKKRKSCVHLINNTALLKKRKVHNHQFAKLLYYSVDLKDQYVASRVIRHALKNNLLTDNNINNLVMTLISKLQKYEYCNYDTNISPKIISAIVKSKSYKKNNVLMEYIYQRPQLTLQIINKSYIEQDEFIALFKTIADNTSVSRTYVAQHSKKALFNTCIHGNKKIFDMLTKEYGISINIIDANQETLLHKAATHGHTQLATQLLNEYTINVNQKNAKHETALHKAALNGHNQIVALLLAHTHTDVNAQDKKSETALHKSASGGHVKVCKTLLMHPTIKINARNEQQETILHKSALSNNIETMRLILSLKKIDINHVDLLGETALHKAAKNKNRDFYYLLANTKDMDTQKKNKHGQTAQQIAMKHGNTNAFKSVLTTNTKKITPKKKIHQYTKVLKMKRNLQTMYGQVI